MKSFVAGLALAALAAGTPAHHQNEYDYVIVGSGPGGGSLAANLARAGHSVFLIEAGQDHGDTLHQRIPAFANAASERADMAWSFFVNHFQNETQARRDDKYTYRMTNGSFYVGLDPPAGAEPLGILYPRGNTLGGSSQVNGMNWALPPDNDWKHIAELTGDDSWAPEHMRQYFTEVEHNEYEPEGTPGHGYHGYVQNTQNNISYVIERQGVSTVVRNAIRLIEHKDNLTKSELEDLLNRDMNRLDPKRYEEQGVYRFPAHVDRTKQRSGARSHIAETLNAKNKDGSKKYPLTLSPSSLASRVLFKHGQESPHGPHYGQKGGKPRAYGVEYLEGEGIYGADPRYDASQRPPMKRVFASKEVIVAGGAFNTPQILKLSGVGPRKELEKLDIPVVVDLPAVGSYMQDNYEGGVTVHAHTPWDNNPYAECKFGATLDPAQDACLDRWLHPVGGDYGPYADAGAPLSIWFRSSVSENKDSDVFLFGAANADFHGFFPGYSAIVAPPTNFFWSLVKMQPGNKAGTVTLKSKDPRATPAINFNWFEQEGDRDLQALSEAAELVLRVFNDTGSPYVPFTVVEPTPGLPIKQAIKDNVFSHHVSSTCRMGPKGDKNYCVDSDFRVNGVDGLRVVDASVFPRSPGAFPVAPTFIISRKAFHTITDGLKHH